MKLVQKWRVERVREGEDREGREGGRKKEQGGEGKWR